MISRFYFHMEGDKPMVAWESSLFSTPKIVTTFWTVREIKNPYARTLPTQGCELASVHEGVFYFGSAVSLRVDSKEQGRQVERDYPCPPTRLKETRYHDGEWRGLSKSRGWIVIPTKSKAQAQEGAR